MDIHLHLDVPKMLPDSNLFSVQGWIISSSAILEVTQDHTKLELIERLDVETAYPNYPFVKGFRGICTQDAIQDNQLLLTYRLNTGRFRHAFTLPRPVRRKEKIAYIVGGYGIAGGNYMNYRIGYLLHTLFDYECVIVNRIPIEEKSTAIFDYPILFKSIMADELEGTITRHALLVVSGASSECAWGIGLSCRKIMYVQGTSTFSILDGFFDAYVSASSYVNNFIYQQYGIASTVIPPFTNINHIATPLIDWNERPARTILVMGKDFFSPLLYKFKTLMKEKYPDTHYEIVIVERYVMGQQQLFTLMSKYRYFLQLSPIEGFGLTPLESMGSGCTFMGFHGLGGLDYLQDGHNCAVSQYPNIEKICDDTAYLLTHPDHAKQLAHNGKNLINSYTLEQFDQNWKNFLQEFL